MPPSGYVFYIDVRTPGKNFDEFYRRAVEEYGVHYIKGMVGKVVPEGGKLKVQASDLLGNRQLHIDAGCPSAPGTRRRGTRPPWDFRPGGASGGPR